MAEPQAPAGKAGKAGESGNAVLLPYRIFLYLAFPVILLRLLCRALQDRRYFDRLPQRLGFAGRRGTIQSESEPRAGTRTRAHAESGGVWIHAVSVGEVNAATPLVEYLLEHYPRTPVTLTTMTPTGADRVAQTFAGRVRHAYLPYDYPGAVRRFLDAVAPRLGVVMETEIWPNLIARCHRVGVPLLYLNVRLSKPSYDGYRRFGKLIRPALGKIRHFAAQTRADADRLIGLGAPPAALSVTGNLKFDVELKPSIGEAAQSVRRDLGRERPVWVAGSTHEGEEAQILDAFARARAAFPSLLLVIAPRHPRRFNAVSRLCARRGYATVLRSQNPGKVDADADIYVADSMGELPMLLAAGDIAFIGGSLVPVGGHNVLEALAAGVPVVFGRHMFNFAEIADLLLQHAAGVQVMDSDELSEVIQKLLADPLLREQYENRGRELIEKNRGALQKIRALVDRELAGRR